MRDWEAVETALTGILDRRWYTNHGPLAQRLEAEAAESAAVRHAIAVTNPTIGLIMLAEALALSGNVILSALAPARCVQALDWAGLTPNFVDVDSRTFGIAAAATAAAVGPATTALFVTNAADLTACPPDLMIYGQGLVGEIDPVLVDLHGLGDDAGSACILTDRDDLAARLRNIRSSYGAGSPVPVVRTANGRFSELQAAMALLIPPNERLQSADPFRFGGHCAISHGRDWLLVLADETERAEMRLGLLEAGYAPTALRLDKRAHSCQQATLIAARAIVVPRRSGPADGT